MQEPQLSLNTTKHHPIDLALLQKRIVAMSYNPRMSVAPRTTVYNQRAPVVNEADAFMTLVRHLSLSRTHANGKWQFLVRR